MRIIADRLRCVGAGQCSLVLPEIFDSDDEGLVVVIGEVTEADADGLRHAVRICPVGALSLRPDSSPAPGTPQAAGR
ncbi:ferredoxin [Streptosporangium amethystogenes]|uniref:ferredoxin n=1 Tax=Streptosporangium amethystogenes TaxID=2002 RepID=UPI0005682C0A|nr:ferredoxin [Streptosporangium amethystogenes]